MDVFMDKINKRRLIQSSDFKLVNNEQFLSCSNKIAKWIYLRTEEFGVQWQYTKSRKQFYHPMCIRKLLDVSIDSHHGNPHL